MSLWMGMALIGLSAELATSQHPHAQGGSPREWLPEQVRVSGKADGPIRAAWLPGCAPSILIHQMGTRVLPSRVAGKDSRRISLVLGACLLEVHCPAMSSLSPSLSSGPRAMQ